MIKIYCDLCGKEVHSFDLKISAIAPKFEKSPGAKYDFHPNCWYRMKEMIRAEKEARE